MRVLLGSAFVTHADHADPWVDARQMTLTTTRSSDTQTHTPEWAYTSLEATSPLPVGITLGKSADSQPAKSSQPRITLRARPKASQGRSMT